MAIRKITNSGTNLHVGAGTTTDLSTEGLLKQYQTAYDTAKASNLSRYNELMDLSNAIIGQYSPGGAMERAGTQKINMQKTQDVGGARQNLISSGLYGTTVNAALPSTWEANVGMSARLTLEQMMQQGYTGALQNKANIIEGREDMYPNLDMMAQLIAKSSSASAGNTRYVNSYSGFKSL
jgi:hypothetical protein